MSPVTNLEVLFQAERWILVSEKKGAVASNPCIPPKVPGDETKEALGIFTSEQDSPPCEERENKSNDAYKVKDNGLRYNQNKPEKCTEP